jgi:hypothetical protein
VEELLGGSFVNRVTGSRGKISCAKLEERGEALQIEILHCIE